MNLLCFITRRHKYREEDLHGFKLYAHVGAECQRKGCKHTARIKAKKT